MDLLVMLRWLHVLGAAILFGTGVGIAFFMFRAHRSRDAAIIAHTASVAVVADYVFTASAVVLQPITGVVLAHAIGWPMTQGWIIASIVLFLLTGACWLPVVWIQTRLRNLAREAARRSAPLPARYYRLYRCWLSLGIPAFVFALGIVWLMLARPRLALLGDA